jgi:polysaccharide export outer membrane protein
MTMNNQSAGVLRFAAALVLVAGMAASVADAQQNVAAAVHTDVPALQPNAIAQLRTMEPAADEEYQLGGGDELMLECAGRPELSGKHVLGPDGRVTLPLAGSVVLSGLTREQAAAAIEKALNPYYNNVAVTVRIDKYGSNRVLLLGYVQHPGVMYFDQTPTLLEAITRAGLITPADKKDGDTVPDRCAIYRGSQQVVWVDVKGLLQSGNPLADMRLRRNDVVFVPNDTDRFVSVLGEVQHPGAMQLRRNSTLPSILADAGGLTERAGNPNIQIVDPASGKTRYIHFKDMLTPGGALEVTLHPGEVIYVPRSGLSKVGYALQQLTPLSSAMSFATMATF